MQIEIVIFLYKGLNVKAEQPVRVWGLYLIEFDVDMIYSSSLVNRVIARRP